MRPRGFKALTAALLAASSIPGCVSTGDTGDHDVATTESAVRVERTELAADGQAYFVRGQLGQVAGRIETVAQATELLGGALPSLVAPFGVRSSDLVADDVYRDKSGMTHVGYAQRTNGLRVVGGDFVVHIAADGTITSANGGARDVSRLTVTPKLTADAAAAIASSATAGGVVDVRSNELVYLLTDRGTAHLAYEVSAVALGVLVHDLVYVDALTGAIVDRHPQVFTARERHVYNANNGTNFFWFSLPEIGTEARPPTGDAIALAAHNGTGSTYDCYDELFDRDSYDGRGGALRSAVHVVFQLPSGGTSGNNAAWVALTGQMVYGDGDGNFMGPTPNGFDVTAHELTHGVTSATANLTYRNESGALNEGMSDIMAAVCESWKDGRVSADTWLVGEDIFTPNTPGDALRYMADPTADADLYPPELGGSRDFYADRYLGTEDNGGVHLNSGIPNLAFQLLTDGGRHPQGKTTFSVPAIGIQKAGAIFQRALTGRYFTANTTLAQARTATETVANELYPGGATARAVGLAWAAVGVGQPPAGGDNQAPTVDITAPADGASVQPGFAVTVNATDNTAVARVDLTIDGAAAGSDTSAPYAFTAPSNLGPGAHAVVATAVDGAGNTASDTVNVTIAAPTPDAGVPTPDAAPGTPDAGPPGTPDARPNPGTPDAGDGGGDPGGCATSHSGGAATLVLMLGLALGLRRRRS